MKILKPLFLAIPVALIVFVANRQQTPAQGQQEKAQISSQIAFVAAGMEDARKKIKSSSAVIKYDQFTPKEFFALENKQILPLTNVEPEEKKDQVITINANWYIQGPKLSMRMEPHDADEDIPFYRRIVANQKQVRSLSSPYANDLGQVPINPSGIIYTPEEMVTNGIIRDLMYLDPRYYAYYRNLTPLDELILDEKWKPTFEGETNLYESRCMKVSLKFDALRQFSFWIDVEHDFLIRRVEISHQEAGRKKLDSEQNVPLLTADNGVWFPSLVETKEYYANEANSAQPKTPGNNVELKPIVKRFAVSDFKANRPIDSTVFSLDWPVGTLVDNHFSRQQYTITTTQPAKSKPSPPPGN